MSTFNTGAYPPGCTQRDVDMAQQGYWDDPYYFQPECVYCDDWGCPECCETLPIDEDDLEEYAPPVGFTLTSAHRES